MAAAENEEADVASLLDVVVVAPGLAEVPDDDDDDDDDDDTDVSTPCCWYVAHVKYDWETHLVAPNPPTAAGCDRLRMVSTLSAVWFSRTECSRRVVVVVEGAAAVDGGDGGKPEET